MTSEAGTIMSYSSKNCDERVALSSDIASRAPSSLPSVDSSLQEKTHIVARQMLAESVEVIRPEPLRALPAHNKMVARTPTAGDDAPPALALDSVSIEPTSMTLCSSPHQAIRIPISPSSHHDEHSDRHLQGTAAASSSSSFFVQSPARCLFKTSTASLDGESLLPESWESLLPGGLIRSIDGQSPLPIQPPLPSESSVASRESPSAQPLFPTTTALIAAVIARRRRSPAGGVASTPSPLQFSSPFVEELPSEALDAANGAPPASEGQALSAERPEGQL